MTRSLELRRVTRNLLATSAGQVLGAALNMATIVVVARALGVEQYGRYAYVLAFVGVFQLLASAGLEQILVREIAVKTSEAQRLVGVARSLTWALSLLTFALIVAGVELTSPDGELRLAMIVAAGAVLATIQAIGYGSVFRAMEEMEVNASAFVLHKIVLLGLVLGGAWVGWGLVGMCVAFLAANVFLWIYYLAVLVRRHFRPRLQVDLALWWSLLRESAPLAVSVIVRRISWHVGVLVLAGFGLTAATGYFTAGSKVIHALNLIPLTLAQTLFPVMSRLARSRTDVFEDVLGFALRCLGLLAFPLALGLAVCAGRVVDLTYGSAFAATTVPLVLMSVALLFMFWTSLYSFMFTAVGAQRHYTIACIVGLAVNAGSALLLVPRLAEVGASIATLAGEVALFAMGTLFIRRLNPGVRVVRLAWRPLLASLVMAAVLWPVRGASLPVLAGGLALAAAVYVAVLIPLRAVSRKELTFFAGEIRRLLRPAVTTPS